nr:hypothetical protein [uncultured Pseudomonas sp.]
MRKVRPQDVKSDFISQVDASLEHYQRVIISLSSTPNEKLDISIMSQTLFHSVFVDFECFLSDLFLAYLNSDFSQYQATFESSVRASVSDKHSPWFSGKISFNVPRHMKIDDIAEAVDPTGWNMTFKSCDVMKTQARKWLATAHRNRICNLANDDIAIIDTARAIRNCIAHQSTGSVSIMNQMLSSVEVGHARNLNLGRGTKNVTSVGAFLKARHAGIPRVVRYAERLKDAAQSLTI